MAKNPLVVTGAAIHLKNTRQLELDLNIASIFAIKSLEEQNTNITNGCNTKDLKAFSFADIAKDFIEQISLIDQEDLTVEKLAEARGLPEDTEAKQLLMADRLLKNCRLLDTMTSLDQVIDQDLWQFLTDNANNRQVFDTLIKNNGKLSQSTPKDLLSYRERILSVVKQNPDALQHVPGGLSRYTRLAIESVRQNAKNLELIPPKLSNYKDIALEAIKKDGKALSLVPVDLNGYKELVMDAIKQNIRALQYVPENLRDRQICLEAVKQSGWALQHVPENLRDREMCLAGVKHYGDYLQYVPELLRDRQMCLAVVKQKGNTLTVCARTFA